MRSLKECYEIAKEYHIYWSEDGDGAMCMCNAAEYAFNDAALTESELHAVQKDAMTLVITHVPSAMFLKQALGNVSDKEVKVFWNNYINNM